MRRHKVLKKLGGSEETFQESMAYMRSNKLSPYLIQPSYYRVSQNMKKRMSDSVQSRSMDEEREDTDVEYTIQSSKSSTLKRSSSCNSSANQSRRESYSVTFNNGPLMVAMISDRTSIPSKSLSQSCELSSSHSPNDNGSNICASLMDLLTVAQSQSANANGRGMKNGMMKNGMKEEKEEKKEEKEWIPTSFVSNVSNNNNNINKHSNKMRERRDWKRNREHIDRYLTHKKTTKLYQKRTCNGNTLHSASKLRNFFGDIPQMGKIERRLGIKFSDICQQRSQGLNQITTKDDNRRYLSRNQFNASHRLKLAMKQKFIVLTKKVSKLTTDSDIHENTDADIHQNIPYLRREKVLLSKYHTLKENEIYTNDNDDDMQLITAADLQLMTCKHSLLSSSSFVVDQSIFKFTNPAAFKMKQKMNKKNAATELKNRRRFNVKYLAKNRKDINPIEIERQQKCLVELLFNRKSLTEIVTFFYVKYNKNAEFIVTLIHAYGVNYCGNHHHQQNIAAISRMIDKPLKCFSNLSVWQFVVRTHIVDVQVFFYNFGPLIGRYKSILSPLHLCVRHMIDCVKMDPSADGFISEKTCHPSAVYALKTFKFLLFVGYDLHDGDIDNRMTPRTMLNQYPRIVSQIEWFLRTRLHFQFRCMQIVDRYTPCAFDIYILNIIEKFTFKSYRRIKY